MLVCLKDFENFRNLEIKTFCSVQWNGTVLRIISNTLATQDSLFSCYQIHDNNFQGYRAIVIPCERTERPTTSTLSLVSMDRSMPHISSQQTMPAPRPRSTSDTCTYSMEVNASLYIVPNLSADCIDLAFVRWVPGQWKKGRDRKRKFHRWGGSDQSRSSRLL